MNTNELLINNNELNLEKEQSQNKSIDECTWVGTKDRDGRMSLEHEKECEEGDERKGWNLDD